MILAALMLLMANMPVLAYDFIENGFAYNILKDGTVALTNKVKDFSFDKAMDQALAYKGAVVVPATVTHSGKKYRVSAIGRNAFYDCRAVTSVNVSEGITRIDRDAFYYCSMTSLTLPASVSKLVPGFLHQCPKLSTITVSPQNRYYKTEGNCIYNKNMTQLIFVSPVLRMYKFPASVRSVADYAFNGSRIKRLVIPATLTHIGGMAFYSNDIKEIICDNPLEKLAGSSDYMPGCPLPIWALSPAAAMKVNVEAAKRAIAGKREVSMKNAYIEGKLQSTAVISDAKGAVSFNGSSYPNFQENVKTRILCQVDEWKDYDSPVPGSSCPASSQQIKFLTVQGPA